VGRGRSRYTVSIETKGCSSASRRSLVFVINTSIISSTTLIHLYCTTQGDHIAVKGSSVQHVVKILHAFGVEIKEGETVFERKGTKMVLVDGSETYTTVVRGTHGFCSLCLCVVPHLTSFAFSLFVIASSTNRDHALCLCENSRRSNQTQDGIVGKVSLHLSALKLHGARGWIFVKELCLQNSKPKVSFKRDPYIHFLLAFLNQILH
jgi:hypothetical protein